MSSDTKPKDSQIEALTAFVKSLNPPPSLHVARENDNEKAARMGRLLFESLHCVDCHREKTFTSPETYDVGIHDELGNQQFNPPSLIGVSQRDRFFHDARATSLADVVGQHHHQLPRAISDSEKQQLMAYLNSL